MKPNHIKNLYPITPQAHKSLCDMLSRLDTAAPARGQKRRRQRRFVAVFAALAALAALSTVAYATGFFGLRVERVGMLGLNMRIAEDAAKAAEKKPVRIVVGYIPEGCELVDGSDETAKYWYTTGGKESGAELSVGFFLTDASDYNSEGRYIVESEELTINGHQAVIGAQQLEAGGDKYWFGVIYFEDRGYVVQCSSNDRDELLKVMQGLDLEEDTDCTEPPTVAETDEDYPEDDYDYRMHEDYRFVEVGEPFGYDEMMYAENDEVQTPDFTVTVRSIEERGSFDGLDQQGFLYGERFSEWFDGNNKLITPYIRKDYDFGDEGLNEQITHTDTLTDRHFMVVTVDVTANTDTTSDGTPLNAWATPTIREDGDHDDYPTGRGQAFLMYRTVESQTQINWKKGDTRTYLFGILVDDEVLEQSCATFESKQYTVDQSQETVTLVDTYYCVMLRGGAAK